MRTCWEWWEIFLNLELTEKWTRWPKRYFVVMKDGRRESRKCPHCRWKTSCLTDCLLLIGSPLTCSRRRRSLLTTGVFVLSVLALKHLTSSELCSPSLRSHQLASRQHKTLLTLRRTVWMKKMMMMMMKIITGCWEQTLPRSVILVLLHTFHSPSQIVSPPPHWNTTEHVLNPPGWCQLA